MTCILDNYSAKKLHPQYPVEARNHLHTLESTMGFTVLIIFNSIHLSYALSFRKILQRLYNEINFPYHMTPYVCLILYYYAMLSWTWPSNNKELRYK